MASISMAAWQLLDTETRRRVVAANQRAANQRAADTTPTKTPDSADDLKAENRKLKKKLAKLQEKLDKVGLALTEPSSDAEDDE